MTARELWRSIQQASITAPPSNGLNPYLKKRDEKHVTFVLVPGAWLGGWCWKYLTPLLRDKGHEVYTPTLTGLGEREHLARSNIDLDLETYVRDIVNVLEYEDLEPIHRLTVDAYAAQHTGTKTSQTTRSVNVHLLGIYLVLYGNASFSKATDAIGTLIEHHKQEFSWLKPPEHQSEITVADVSQANDLNEHTELIRGWARSVWNAWENHHDTINEWAQTVEEY